MPIKSETFSSFHLAIIIGFNSQSVKHKPTGKAILGQAPKATLQVIPAAEPESRAKTILFFLCLIL
jgi:hypothetical protein